MTDVALATTTETAEPVETPEQAPPANDVDPSGEATEQPAETPAAAAAEEKKERESALFNRSLKFREEATAKLQKAEQTLETFRREREEFSKQKSEVDKFLSIIERVKEDPYVIFDEFKIEPADHMHRMIAMNEPVARELANERKKREELEAKWERKEREAKEAAEVQAKQNYEFNVANAKRNFASFADANAEKYPEIAFEDPEELGEIFWDAALQLRQKNQRTATFEEVADHLQKLVLDRRAKKDQLRQQRLGARASEPGGGNTAPQRTAPNGQTANGPGPRTPTTLTNRAATSVATAPREDATDEEKHEWARRELRRAMAADHES